MTRVLVIEDEESFRDALEFILTKEGFQIESAATGSDGLTAFDKYNPDIILLDLMLPGMSGTDVCKSIRAKSNVPIIMLTAKDAEVDKVVGLEVGADDYVTKPFSSPELIARIRAVLRRGSSEPRVVDEDIIELGPIKLDIARHSVQVNSQEVTMPLKEFEVLEYLMENSGRVLTRGQLMDRIWGSNYVGDGKTLDVHIKRIRSKIEQDPANPTLLHTLRGLGYKFEVSTN
jgi:two-component system response regulator RegX3